MHVYKQIKIKMVQVCSYAISLLAVVGFSLIVLHEITNEPYPRFIDGPAMEVDQGSKVISLLVPIIVRIAVPLLLIVSTVAAVLLAIASLLSLDEICFRFLRSWFIVKPE